MRQVAGILLPFCAAVFLAVYLVCLLYTSDAADEL